MRNNFVHRKDWDNPYVFSKNSQPPRAHADAFCDVDNANNNIKIDKINLNGRWKFLYLASVNDSPEDFCSLEYCDDDWDSIVVPGMWELNGYGMMDYLSMGLPNALSDDDKISPKVYDDKNPAGLYRTYFNYKQEFLDNKVCLRFDGISTAMEVYVNGNYAGYTQDNSQTTEFEISHHLKEGSNLIALKVIKYSDACYLNGRDTWHMGGIIRDVYILVEPQTYISDIYARCVFDEEYDDAQLLMDVEITDYFGRGSCSISVDLIRDDDSINLLYSKIGLSLKSYVYVDRLIKSPLKWSDENPELYTIRISISGNDDTLLQIKQFKFGFRQVAVVDNKLLINGKQVMLKGVTRKEFSGNRGLSMSHSMREKDVLLLKRNNFNAIINFDGMCDKELFMLCDKYGIYVIDEININTNDDRPYGAPGERTRWRDACQFRAKKTVLINRNHASIIVWSLGRNTDVVKNISHVKTCIKELDTTRPFLFEYDYSGQVSDIIASGDIQNMRNFGRVMESKTSFLFKDINIFNYKEKQKRSDYYFTINKYNQNRFSDRSIRQAMSQKRWDRRPVILTSCPAPLGNGMGGFYELYKKLKRYHSFNGLFISDFAERTIISDDRSNPSGRVYQYCGKNRSLKHIDTNNVCGLVSSDRNAYPAIKEMKKAFQPFEIYYDNQLGQLSVVCNYLFKDSSNHTLSWKLMGDGVAIIDGIIDISGIKNGEGAEYSVPCYNYIDDIKEYVLEACITMDDGANWCRAKHEVAFESFILTEYKYTKPVLDGDDLIANDMDDYMSVDAGEFSIKVSKNTGYIETIDYGNGNVLSAPIKFNFLRSMTSIDKEAVKNSKSLANNWDTWGKWADQIVLSGSEMKLFGDNVQIICKYSFGWTGHITSMIKVHRSGDIYIDNTLTSIKPAIRFGMTANLFTKYTQVEFYGYGPFETYKDRYIGSKLGIHTVDINDMTTDYTIPQENGNRHGVRYMRFVGNQDSVTLHSIDNLIDVSIWPYAQRDLDLNTHLHTLPNRPTQTMNVDYGQKGLGAAMLEPSATHGNTNVYRYSFIIRNELLANR